MVKIIVKQYPIYEEDAYISKMALAVYLLDTNKFLDFHNTLMQAEDINPQTLSNILSKLGLKEDSVKDKMEDAQINKTLEDIKDRTHGMGVRGVPTYIIGEELLPGDMSLDVLKNKIKSLREKEKSRDRVN